jgi:hypothetical protein
VEVSADIHQLLHFGLAQAQARTALHKGCDSLAFRTAGGLAGKLTTIAKRRTQNKGNWKQNRIKRLECDIYL